MTRLGNILSVIGAVLLVAWLVGSVALAVAVLAGGMRLPDAREALHLLTDAGIVGAVLHLWGLRIGGRE